MPPLAWNLLGLALFLFIPLVLFLFVAHPEPVAVSLGAGVFLMLGHRFLARPYMERVRERKCVWCNRFLAEGSGREWVGVAVGDSEVDFVACSGHAEPARRLFAWLDRLRLPLRLGIGAPLVALLAALAAAATGDTRFAAVATDLFRLLVGLTVQIAALGSSRGSVEPSPEKAGGTVPRATFPLHNFALLGIRNILWIFRLVGLWWIVAGGHALFTRLV